jgi:hypothetical protein
MAGPRKQSVVDSSIGVAKRERTTSAFDSVLGWSGCSTGLFRSEYGTDFVPEGRRHACFAAWTGNVHRPTRDLDLLGFGESSQSVWSFCSVACAIFQSKTTVCVLTRRR